MDIATTVKLLTFISGASLLGIITSLFLKFTHFRQYKRLEKESSGMVIKTRTRIDHLMAHNAEGILDEEIEHTQRTADLDDQKKVEALLSGIDVMIAKGEYEDAERHLISALGIDPENMDVRSLMGFIYMKQEKYNKAESVYLEMIEKGTIDPGIYSNLGKVLEEQGNLETAITAYREAIVKDPQEPKRYIQLADVYITLEKTDVAIPLLEEALRLDNDNIPLRFRLIELYGIASNEDAQIALLKDILALDATNDMAKKLLESIRK